MSVPSGSPNLTLQEPNASIVPHLLLFVCQFVVLALPPFHGRRTVFCMTIIYLAIQAHLNPHFTNNVGLAQPFTIAWSYYMNTLAKLLFSGIEGPEAHFWRIDKPEKEALSYEAFGLKKIRWAVMLVLNQRGIRWNFQVKNVPGLPTRSRIGFLALQAYKFFKYMLIADLLFELSPKLFFTPPNGQIGQVDSKYLTLRHPDWRWSFAKAFVFGATPYFMLSMQYAQFAFISVLLGFSKPEDWPSPFGRLANVTTVREFWGKYWHQQLRYMLTTYSDAFANFLEIRRGTNLSSYTKLYLSFGISGMFHALSQMTMPCPTNITPVERTLGFFLFFVWQMVAITLEDFAQWVYKRAGFSMSREGGKMFRTTLGYVWVTLSFWACLPLVGDTFLRMRMGIDSFLPFSVTRSLVDKYVPIPP